MPDPDYNTGDMPPFWFWFAALLGFILVVVLIASC